MKQVLAKLNNIAAYIASISAILSLLVVSVDANCFNSSFYANEYHKLETAQTLGMTDADLNKATNTLLDYLKGDRNDIKAEIQVKGTKTEAFNAKEASHMVDVRSLYNLAITIRNICIALLIISLAYLFITIRKSAFTNLSIAFIKTAILFAVVFIMIGIWAIADFDTFWTAFHKLAFRNDLWLLDPSTDLMINLFPSAFFSNMVMRIIAWFSAGFGTLCVLSYTFLSIKLRKVHKEIIKQDEI